MNIVLIDFWSLKSGGGAERVLSNMANDLYKRGHSVTVICCDTYRTEPFYKFNKNIKFVCLEKKYKLPDNIFLKIKKEYLRLKGALDANKKDYFYITMEYKAILLEVEEVLKIAKADVIISFEWRSLILLNIFSNLRIPIIAMIHTCAELYFNNSISEIKLEAFRRSKCIQVLLKSDVAIVQKYCPNTMIECIPNYVPKIITDNKIYNLQQDTHSITMVARINKDKQQLHLLQAYNKIKDKFKNWNIFFYGATSKNDVTYEKKLFDFVEKNDLKEKVFFMGLKENVISELVKHDIFAFPSKYEGLSMALIEAMSSGLPAIGYKTSPGVNELIKDGYNGFLCDNNIDSFANKLSILMQSQEIREEMGKNAANSMEEFSANNILNKWEVLINKIVEEDKENEKF